MSIDDIRKKQPIRVHRAVFLSIIILPAVSTALFYLLRSNKGVMDWAALYVSAPIRGVLGLLSSIYPFSLMEVLCAAGIAWFIYYIVKTIIVTARRRDKMKLLAKRLLPLAVAILYVLAAFNWLWSSGYHATSFAERYGFSNDGAAVDDLIAVTAMFASKANEMSSLVNRDDEGRCIEDRREFFSASSLIYQNLFKEYPGLEGRLYRPKPMMFSWLMSRTGYTGIYFALTGESNINTNAPVFLMPATVAHEMAHQRGIFSEDEANFVGIMSSISSGYIAYEYAGYMMGLMYLRNALIFADYDAWSYVTQNLAPEVIRDLQDHFDFWQSQRTVKTGVDLFDRILTTMTETLKDTVDSVYDGFLKSQDQELGLQSYGACVDLLVEYFTTPNS